MRCSGTGKRVLESSCVVTDDSHAIVVSTFVNKLLPMQKESDLFAWLKEAKLD